MATEKDFIDKLDNFTTALEDLVELLKEQEKIGPTEVVNQLLHNLDAEKISMIASNVEDIRKNTKQLVDNQQKVIEELKAIRSTKEQGGLFGEIKTKDGKNNVVDGIKTIILIAGGVLAIGLAFQIVGKVDFFSVVALGLSMIFVAEAFSKIAKIENLTLKKTMMVAGVLTIMSAAVLASGLILDKIPSLNLFQFITIAGIGLTVGIATYFLLKSLEKVDIKKNWATILLLPLVLPLISASILASAFILKGMPIIELKQLLSAFEVGLALVPAALAVYLISKSLGGLSLGKLILTTIAIPLISYSIVWSAKILKDIVDIPLLLVLKAGLGVGIAVLALTPALFMLDKSNLTQDFKKLVVSSLAIVTISAAVVVSSFILTKMQKIELGTVANGALGVAIAVTSMTPAIWILTKAGLTEPKAIVNLLIAGASIVIISAAIVASSWILSFGTYDSYPPLMWTLGVGISIVAFAVPMLFLGILSETGIGLGALAVGALAMLLVAGTIVASSYILSAGKYGNYPTLSWSMGSGLAMLGFGIPMVALGVVILASFGLGLAAMAAGATGMLLIADTVQKASHLLAKGNYAKYPTLEWSSGVGLALSAFANTYSKTQPGVLDSMFGGSQADTFTDFVTNIAYALVAASEVFNLNKGTFNVGNVPSKEWSEGVGIALVAFAETYSKTQPGVMDRLMGALTGDKSTSFIEFVKSASQALVEAAKIFEADKQAFNLAFVPSKEWSEGVGTALVAFTEMYKKVNSTGSWFESDEKTINRFNTMTQSIVQSLITTAKMFNKPGIFDEKNVPSKEWGENIGATLTSFVNVIAKIQKDLDIEPENISPLIIGMGNAILWASYYFSKAGKYKMPPDDWIKNFNSFTMNALIPLIVVLKMANNVSLGIFNLRRMTDAIVYMSRKFNKVASDDKANVFAPGGLGDNISRTMDMLVNSLPKDENIDPLFRLIDAIEELSEILSADMFGYLSDFTKQINNITDSLNRISTEKVDNLMRFTAGLQMMGLVDTIKLERTLAVIEAKQKALSNVVEDGFFQSMLNGVSNIFGKKEERNTTPTATINAQQKAGASAGIDENYYKESVLKFMENIDKNVETMVQPASEDGEKVTSGKDVTHMKVPGS